MFISALIYSDHADRCKGNMSRIKRKQGNPDTVVGFFRPSMDIGKPFSTLLFKRLRVNCSFPVLS